MHSVKSKGRRSQALVGSSQEAVICALPSQEKHKERGTHVYQSTLQCLGLFRKKKLCLNNWVAGKEDYGVIGSAGNVVQKEGISKEAELPLTTGSQVNGKEAAEYPCEIPNEELLKLMRDQKKNANGQEQEKSTVSNIELVSQKSK